MQDFIAALLAILGTVLVLAGATVTVVISITKLNGVTHNPWRHGRTVGGSSAGSAAAVAGGLVSIATGGDGGGSLRIPGGYTGMVGMKGTFGRISRGPHAMSRPHTVVLGTIARSVRDVARHYDVTAGPDPRDPWSLPDPGGWESGLGSTDLAGRRVAILPSIGRVALEPGVEDLIRAQAKELIRVAGMVEVDVTLELPNLAAQWMMGNLSTLLAELGPLWPKCAYDLTDEVALGLQMAQGFYNLNLAAVAEAQRLEANEAMASAFEQADVIICATNPGPAFPAENTMSNPNKSFLDDAKSSRAARSGFRGLMGAVRLANAFSPRLGNTVIETIVERVPDLVSMGGLTIPANIYGNPSVSVPGGLIDGLPVGMQIMAPHHHDAELLDVALTVEREIGWPKVAPGVARSVAPAPA